MSTNDDDENRTMIELQPAAEFSGPDDAAESPTQQLMAVEEDDEEDGAVFLPEDRMENPDPDGEDEEEAERHLDSTLIGLNPNFTEEALFSFYTRVCIVCRFSLRRKSRKALMLLLGGVTALVFSVFAVAHFSFVHQCDRGHDFFRAVLRDLEPAAIPNGWPVAVEGTAKQTQVLAAVELTQSSDVTTHVVSPLANNTNQSAAFWLEALRAADFVFAGSDAALLNMSSPSIVCQANTSTYWCNPEQILTNYTLIQAKVGRWAPVFGQGPAVALVNTVLSPSLAISNSLKCHAQRTAHSLMVLVRADGHKASFNPDTPHWLWKIGVALYRLATVLCSFAALSVVSSFKIWVYTMYMIPAMGQLAQRMLRHQDLPPIHPEHMAPWCRQPGFAWHGLLAAVLAWGGFPGLVLSLLAQCYPEIQDFPGYVYGLLLFSEAFVLLMARTRRTISQFCLACFWSFSLTCGYALAYGSNGCWGVLTLGAHLVVLLTGLHCLFEHEIQSYETLSNTKPREHRYPAVFGRGYGEIPPFWEYYQDGPCYVHHDRMGGLHVRRRAGAGSSRHLWPYHAMGLVLCALLYVVFVPF